MYASFKNEKESGRGVGRVWGGVWGDGVWGGGFPAAV